MTFSKQEYRNLEVIKKTNPHRPIFFDVGGNKGYYTELLLKEFNPEKIYVFEPVPGNCCVLQEKFKDERVDIYPCACTNTNGFFPFWEIIDKNSEDAEGLSSLNRRAVYTKFNCNKINVCGIKLDDFIITSKINKINYIKIDTEGNELNVLSGLITSLQNKIIDYIQIEYGSCIRETGKDLEDILNLLHPFGYKLYDVLNGESIQITKTNVGLYKQMEGDYLISKDSL